MHRNTSARSLLTLQSAIDRCNDRIVPASPPSARATLRVEVVDDDMARVLATKTPAERLAIASGMFRSARRMLEASLRADHPGWDDDRLRTEVARRLSSGSR